LFGEEEFEIESTLYKCTKCGTEMTVESHGGGLFSTYPDEDTFPDEDIFPDENVLF
jgi:hypothetical protein